MHRPALRLVAFVAVLTVPLLGLAAAHPLEPSLEPLGGPCPGAPLACVRTSGADMAVAIGVPARSVVVLVGGASTQVGPVFGSGRLCVAEPRVRLGCGQADDEGTAVVRIAASMPDPATCWVQLLWRDPLSGQVGASAVARW